MPSLEALMLGSECVRWLSNVRSNMRSNASAYKIRAALPKTVLADLAAEIAKDGEELGVTVAAIETLLADVDQRAKIAEYLGAFGIRADEIDAAVAELKSAASDLAAQAKTIASGGDVATVSDAVLSNVVEYVLPKRVF